MPTRAHRLILLTVLLSASLPTCQARLVDSDEPVRQKYCTGVNAASVLDESGEPIRFVVNEKGIHTWLCWCLTLEEALAKRDEVNDIAYEVCLEDAAAMGYPEANDCAYWHSINHWAGMFTVWPIHEDIECEVPQPEAGCGVE